MEYQTAESGTGSCCYTRSSKQKVGYMALFAKDYHQDGIALVNSKDLKDGAY